MKTAILSLAAILLAQLVSAQPHRHHAHNAAHARRDVATVVATQHARATAKPNLIIYVDQHGTPISTYTAPTPSSTGPSTPTLPSGSGFGLAYNPYNSDGSCKTQDQVDTDFKGFKGYGIVRTYGIDCNQAVTVLKACRDNNIKLFQGIFTLNDIAGSVKTIAAAANNDWSAYHTISIANEMVDSGQADAGTVMDAVLATRTALRLVGYQGPVVTVDTLMATKSNPILCDKSDYCAVNCHPFFDPNTEAADAGKFVTDSIAVLRSNLVNPNQTILIAETGWPSQGNANSKAVPSSQNQQTAISALKSAFSSNPSGVILLSPYNMMFKTSNAAQFNAEQWWGFMGICPSG